MATETRGPESPEALSYQFSEEGVEVILQRAIQAVHAVKDQQAFTGSPGNAEVHAEWILEAQRAMEVLDNVVPLQDGREWWGIVAERIASSTTK